MSGDLLTFGALVALVVVSLRRGSRQEGRTWQQDESLAWSVYEALMEKGGALDDNGFLLHGPSPLRTLILTDATDDEGDPVIWINWIEGSRPGASAFLEQTIREVTDGAVSVAGETQNRKIHESWLRRDYGAMSEDEASEIYEDIQSRGFYFRKVLP